MARTAITAQSIGVDGLNITDMTMTTMSTGATNGVIITHEPNTKLLLRNGTGGNATYTIKTKQPDEFSGHGITVPDETIVLATAKDLVYTPDPLAFKQSDGTVLIDCDVAAKIAVIRV